MSARRQSTHLHRRSTRRHTLFTAGNGRRIRPNRRLSKLHASRRGDTCEASPSPRTARQLAKHSLRGEADLPRMQRPAARPLDRAAGGDRGRGIPSGRSIMPRARQCAPPRGKRMWVDHAPPRRRRNRADCTKGLMPSLGMTLACTPCPSQRMPQDVSRRGRGEVGACPTRRLPCLTQRTLASLAASWEIMRRMGSRSGCPWARPNCHPDTIRAGPRRPVRKTRPSSSGL
mmetsp:Transcript_2107/g.9233  ORF Transcript_2107/g.9233 Transcript_2107/m.9233 type:complete len:230 (-) Transcript_2107:621-1310(-)